MILEDSHLLIDTHSFKSFHIALAKHGKIIAKAHGIDAAMFLARDIKHLIAETSQDRLASAIKIRKIIIITGPGSMTGLRIGAATAKGLGVGWGVRLYGVSVFDVIFSLYKDIIFYMATGTSKWIVASKTDNMEVNTIVVNKEELTSIRAQYKNRQTISNEPEQLAKILQEDGIIGYQDLLGPAAALAHQGKDIENPDLLYGIAIATGAQ